MIRYNVITTCTIGKANRVLYRFLTMFASEFFFHYQLEIVTWGIL